VTTRFWDIVFMATALLSAIVGAYSYVVGVLQRDRPLARIGAAGFFFFSLAAVLYYWKFL
jgi:hypothetical protein